MHPAEIEGLLASAFPSLTLALPNGVRGPWVLPLLSDRGSRLRIAVDDNWASLQLQAQHARASAALEAVAAQSAWPGGVKHSALQPPARLRADIPLLVNTAAGRDWVVQQLRLSSASMLIAAGLDAHPEASSEVGGPLPEAELLAFACTAGGWNAAVKADGTVRIDVPIRGALRSVMLQAGEAGIRTSVALAAGALAGASAPCRAAAGHFLLRASAALRWARAFARGENAALDAVGFECLIAAPPDEQALLMAVDTLTAACELFGREVEVLLEHAEIADRYTERMPGFDREAEDDCLSTGVAALHAASPSRAAHAALA
jgi:hypothetical protein